MAARHAMPSTGSVRPVARRPAPTSTSSPIGRDRPGLPPVPPRRPAPRRELRPLRPRELDVRRARHPAPHRASPTNSPPASWSVSTMVTTGAHHQPHRPPRATVASSSGRRLDDRRKVIVRLTPAGLGLVDKVAVAHLATDARAPGRPHRDRAAGPRPLAADAVAGAGRPRRLTLPGRGQRVASISRGVRRTVTHAPETPPPAGAVEGPRDVPVVRRHHEHDRGPARPRRPPPPPARRRRVARPSPMR